MNIVSVQVPNLIQGVSQQPPQMRLPSQLEEQVNAYPSLSDGLTKRPPTNHVKRLTTDAPDQFIHFINRDSSERYVVRITASGLKVFTLAGVEKTVYDALTNTNPFTFPTYLNTPGNIRAITIADYTFLLNRGQTVAMGTTTSAAAAREGLVTIIQASYSTDYSVTIKVGANQHTYTNTTISNSASTTGIVTALVSSINSATGTTGLTATSYGSTFLVSHGTSDFSLKVSDSGGGSLMSCAKGKVSRLADLPLQAKHGFKVAVGAAVDEPEASDYYVEFVANDGASGTGFWQESVGFLVKTGFDATSLPFVLVRRSDGHFSCFRPSWTTRTAGDSSSSPDPSIVGRKIKDIFLFRNRLGFVADDKVVLSESGFYFNFFRTTTTQILPTDPIDVSVGHSKIASLEAAVPWDERLILFSPLTQFSLGSGGDTVLSPETVEIVQTTEFENASDLCRPEATGRSLLFPQRRGSYVGMREYIRISSDEKYDGMDITANVPSYISGSPTQIAVSTHDSTGFVRTSDGVWNYKWFVNGTEKIQSAWSRWDFGFDAVIRGMEWFDHSLYLVLTRGGQTVLERVDFGGRFLDAPLDWGVHLDRRLKVSCTTTGAPAGSSIINVSGLDINFTGLGVQVIVNGLQANVESVSGSQIVITGRYNSSEVWIGVPYEMTWTFSQPFVRNGSAAIVDAKLQLNYLTLSFEDTGYFTTTVQPKYRDPYSYLYSAGHVGSNLTAGAAFLGTSSFRFPIHCKSNEAKITVSSSSFLPCRIQSAAFEGRYTTRNQPV
jgi:hypothetical protein